MAGEPRNNAGWGLGEPEWVPEPEDLEPRVRALEEQIDALKLQLRSLRRALAAAVSGEDESW